jgi:hypothetical protein
MPSKRQNYSAEFKFQVALEAAKGQKTVNELASEFGVHSNRVSEVDPLDELPHARPEAGVIRVEKLQRYRRQALFDRWAADYDRAVASSLGEFPFDGYEDVLATVVAFSPGWGSDTHA